MQNGENRVWPAATVRVGDDVLLGKVLAMVGDGSVQRKLIAAADHLIPAEDFPGMWVCRNEAGRDLGLVTDEAVHANTDLLLALARRKRSGELGPEPDRYTRGQLWALAAGTLILAAAAYFFGRG